MFALVRSSLLSLRTDRLTSIRLGKPPRPGRAQRGAGPHPGAADRLRSAERRGLGEAELGVGPDDDRLQRADAGGAVAAVGHPHDAVAVLVDPVGDLDLVAALDVLAVDLEVAPELPVDVALEAAVEPGAEVEAGRRDRLDVRAPARSRRRSRTGGHRRRGGGCRRRTRAPGRCRGTACAARRAARWPLRAAGRPAVAVVALVVDEQRERPAVRLGHGDGHPQHERRRPRRRRGLLDVVERLAHAVADTPRAVAGADPGAVVDLDALAVDRRPNPGRRRSGGSAPRRRRAGSGYGSRASRDPRPPAGPRSRSRRRS